MPTTLRLILFAALLASAGYAALYAMATMLAPPSQEVTVTVPPSRYAK